MKKSFSAQQFSFDTVEDFDKHINSSITGYNLLDKLIIELSSFFIKNNTVPIDLGCTSGRLIKKINDTYSVQSIGYDITEKQFTSGLNLIKQDITDHEFTIPTSDIIYSIFTIQFIDTNKRLEVLKKVYKSLNKRGCFIFCEKEFALNSEVHEAFIFSNYNNKLNNFTSDEILSKEKDLRKIMTPLNSEENIKLLKQAGFKTIDTFFQSLNFKGYICIK